MQAVRTAVRFLAVGTIFILPGLNGLARAHPHILTDLKVEIIFDSDGSPTAVREKWLFDAAYSAMVLRERTNPSLTELMASDLSALAKKRIEALGEFDFYTAIKVGPEKVKVPQPSDYRMNMDQGRLSLEFTLNLPPGKKTSEFSIEVFDPQFLAYFSMPGSDGVSLVGASGNCQQTIQSAPPIDLRRPSVIPAPFWAALDGSAQAAALFVNRIEVACR